MIDLKWIRQHPEALDAGLARRGEAAVAAEILRKDERYRALTTQLQAIRTRRKTVADSIGAISQSGADIGPYRAEAASLREQITALEQEQRVLKADLDAALLDVPNLPDSDAPDGVGENDNVEIRTWGEPPRFEFTPKEHDALGEALGMMDFETAAKVSGARFVVLTHGLARLSRALGQFMLDLHTTQHGYTEMNVPILVRKAAMVNTGKLPKFCEEMFAVDDSRWLAPTGEVPLMNMVADKILDPKELPLRLTAHTLCFRAEAGAAGKDTRGMIRLHQFEKVEMASIVHPDQSDGELSRMTGCAEKVLQCLELPYRVVALCTGDMGFTARRTYDIEVWLPGQGRYREISSCSNDGDFQARRLQARFRPHHARHPVFVHSLNGSGVAIGRCLVAIMENHQQADGSISIPEALKPYMGEGVEIVRTRC